MIPMWRALPLWAKIITAPMILSATVSIVIFAGYTLVGVVYALSAAFEASANWFRKASRTTHKIANNVAQA